MSEFDELLRLQQASALVIQAPGGRLAVCPALGGRVFAEMAGRCLHRLDLETVANPNRPFNNFGGNNFWPAPEGGSFGFNYRGSEWYVQPAINSQPFTTVSADKKSALLRKRVTLINRTKTRVEALMQRQVRLAAPPPGLKLPAGGACLGYETEDTLQVINEVSTETALMAAWSLEQFTATDTTLSFCAVREPRAAINFDFYAHPGARIGYHEKGFTYRTDGKGRGQIGIRQAAGPAWIGFADKARKLVCLRINQGPADGIYFNIADNDQPKGPLSAADSYSIFNSDPDMNAFELETVGAARAADGLLKGSVLNSLTLFAVAESPAELDAFLALQLGAKVTA